MLERVRLDIVFHQIKQIRNKQEQPQTPNTIPRFSVDNRKYWKSVKIVDL